MKRYTFVLLLLATLAMLATTVAAQVEDPPPPQTEEQQAEDQWIQMKLEQGESHASGMRPELGPVILGNPTQAVVTLRVGLYYSFTSNGTYSEFSTLSHPYADISNTVGTVHVLDETSGKQIIDIEPGMIVHLAYDGTGYQVSLGGTLLGTFAGPIFFRPTDGTNLFRVESIRRYNKDTVPYYRGAIEIARGRSTAVGKVNVVNVVELEDYVPGVVTNESLSWFEVEALKAQAVAARGYAVANIGRYVGSGYPFDIVDSSSSQVYRGVISEVAKGVQAANETTGLVASYNGQIISAMYSSSFGGHSESNDWIFPFPSWPLPGANPTPYLRGIYDGDGIPPDFSTDLGIADFWNNLQPTIFDDCQRVGNTASRTNRFSRWKLVLTAAQIKARLLPPSPIRHVVISGDVSGDITDVQITQRMGASARAAVATITLTSGVVEVRGWDNLRNVLGRTAVSTPSICELSLSNIAANFTLNNPNVIEVTKNLDGTVNYITASGGGWGHNVGLSQYGSNGRAKAGQNFLQILKAYYTGVDVGAYPIDIGRAPGTGTPTLREQFYAPNGKGTLVVRSTGLKGLSVHINETYDLSFDETELAAGIVSVDVSPYLVPGINTVQYNPVGRDGTATVTVVVD